MKDLKRLLDHILGNRRGNVAVTTALALTVLVTLAGGVVDYSFASRNKSGLQAIADNAAIAAAREVSLANTNAGQIRQAALAAADKEIASQRARNITRQVTVSSDKANIEVKLEQTFRPFFGAMLNRENRKITATATASVVGAGNICLMGLSATRAKTISLTQNANLVGNGCGIFSRSQDPESIAVKDNASIRVEFVCAAGGIRQRASSQVLPTGLTDCPTPPDPMAKRPLPKITGCDYNKTRLKEFTGTLQPGVYCGGLEISKNSRPILASGVYIIKDGPLIVSDGSELTGEGVGFFLTGKDASFKLYPRTTISLKAPLKGAMAGILFFQDPRVPGADNPANDATKNLIRSENARVLEGTIYLPRGRLKIDASGSVAQESAYTAIVADQVILEEGPTMVLNSDYSNTSVPVPTGLAGGRVVLTK